MYRISGRIDMRRFWPYTAFMQKKSLFEQNPHLKNAQAYQEALRVNVLSSMAIEGVRKAAEKALSTSAKTAKS
jgi:hypothetical protein